MLEEQKALAEKRREIAESLRKEAETAKARADEARREAEAARQTALDLKEQAEESANESRAFAGRLRNALDVATKERKLAEEQAALARKREKEIADALSKLGEKNREADQANQAKISAEVQANQINNQKLRELERAALVDRATTSFSPDGKTLLTISADDKARLRDAHSGQLLATLAGSSTAITSAAFAPSGKYVATAEEDGTVRLWETTDGRAVQSFEGSDTALKLAFSPAGRRLGVAGNNGESLIYEASSGKVLAKLASGQQPVIDLSFSNDGQSIATTNADQRTTLWKTGPGGTLPRSELSDAACRPAIIEMAKLSLTSDLRLSLLVETRCLGPDGSVQTISSLEKAKQLTEEDRKKVKEAMRKAITIDLDDALPAKASSAAQPAQPLEPPHPNPLPLKPAQARVGTGLEKQVKVVLDIYQRQTQSDWEELSHVSYAGSATPAATAIIEQLARRGLSDKQIKAISAAAYRLGQALDGVPRTNTEEYQRVGWQLQREVFIILGLGQPFK